MITVDFAFRLAESINTILTLERGASYSETWSAANTTHKGKEDES
jgi:hypothetical protein